MEDPPRPDPLAAEVTRLRAEVRDLHLRLDKLARQPGLTAELGSALRETPHTMLLSERFLPRAFAVLGHYVVASLLIAVPFYLLFFLVFFVFLGLGEG